MSDEQTPAEIMAEMQALMKRQMELQNKLLKTNWNGFNDALGAFMGMFSDLSKATQQTEENVKDEKTEQE